MSLIFWFLVLVVIGAVCAGFDRMPTELTDVKSGYEYERYCAHKLEEAGWCCTVTQASGDQGVDIIATRHGVKAAIQCKFYKGSVGNKAVQEVISGMIYAKADVAIVIINSYYTESAMELANAASVLLVTHDDIPQLHEQIGRAHV